MDIEQMADDVLEQQEPRGKSRLKSGPMFSHDKVIEDMFVPEKKKVYSGDISEDYTLADERIVPVLETLNKKGYRTVASCAGYSYPGHCIEYDESASPYVLFKDDKNIDKLIEGTEWEKHVIKPPTEEEYARQKKFFPIRHKGVSIHLHPKNLEKYEKKNEKFFNTLSSIFSEMPRDIEVRRGKMFFMNPKTVTQKDINILGKYGVSVDLKDSNKFILNSKLKEKHEFRDNFLEYPRKKALEQWKLLEKNAEKL